VLARVGFLTTGDGYAPGNYALLDVVAALRWVADNVVAFGGNSASVTLFGHGVGAMLVSLLTLSPLTRGLRQSRSTLFTYVGGNQNIQTYSYTHFNTHRTQTYTTVTSNKRGELRTVIH